MLTSRQQAKSKVNVGRGGYVASEFGQADLVGAYGASPWDGYSALPWDVRGAAEFAASKIEH
jgi:hypothetical protein